MENLLTYKKILDRCESLARDILPELPTENTADAWQEYSDSLEEVREDSFSLVLETVENTDWAIYTHYGWKILHALPQSDINDAEDQWLEFNAGLSVGELCGGCFDVWSIPSEIAFHALVSLTMQALDDALEEMQELATTQMENL